MGKFKKFLKDNKGLSTLNESFLSRLHKHMEEHDSGTISAYRKKYTPEQNKKRNYSLLAKLSYLRYQTTEVDGSYIENFNTDDSVEVKERVYFVVDAADKGNLEKDLRALGEEFDQDSIMFIPKGGSTGNLIGTSHRKKAFPQYGQVEKYLNAVWGKEGEFMTKVHGRPYFFESANVEENVLPEGYFGRYGCAGVAKIPWEELWDIQE